jgi:IS605 OrfB family transposase
MSRVLWNTANSIITHAFTSTTESKKQGLVERATYLNYHAINRILIDQKNPAYEALPRKVSNQTLMQLDKAWKGFFASMKSWKRNPSKFLGMPRIPRFLGRRQSRLAFYDLQAISKKALKQGLVSLSGTDIEVPFMNREHELKAARVVPMKGGDFKVEVIYERQTPTINETDNKKYAAIDLGINNLAAITFSEQNRRPVLVNGKRLKSINRLYNKKKGEMQSTLMEMHTKRRCSKAIDRLTEKRNRRIKHEMHETSRGIVDLLVSVGVTDLIIGHNEGGKQEVSIGDRNNQNFCQVPHAWLISMLTYKCAMAGIRATTTEESYTSKASFLDLDHMPVYGKEKGAAPEFSGYRQSRGRFKLKDQERWINADVNGSYNIMRKVVPEVFAEGIEGFAVSPERFKAPESKSAALPFLS